MLINHRDTHTPEVLDPLLNAQNDCYAMGLISSIFCFVPDNDMKAKHYKSVKIQGSKSDTNSGKRPDGREGGKSEGSRRSTSMSSGKSSVSDSKETKSRSETSQKIPPKRGSWPNSSRKF